MSDDSEPRTDSHAQRVAVRDGYDEEALAASYRDQREAHDLTVTGHIESLLVDLGSGGRVLDAGCGQGVPVLNRLPAGVDGVGVDLSVTMLRTARERTDAALVRGDVTRLPVASGTVDAVTALGSVIHVPVTEHPDVYAEFARVLRPGGRLLLTAAPDEEGWSGTNSDWLGSGKSMVWSFPGIHRTREQLRDAGFRLRDEHVLGETVSDGDADGGSWRLVSATRHEE